MRQILLADWLLCLVTIPPFRSAAQDHSEIAKVRALENKVVDAYKHREIDQLASVLDDDFVITFEDGTTYSKTGYISFSATPSVKIDVAEISELKIRIH